MGEVSGIYQTDRLAEVWISMVVFQRLIPGCLFFSHFLGGQAEQEKVFCSYLIADLDIRAVQGPDRERPVQSELHIARTGSFIAGRGDLLGQVCGRVNPLGLLNIVVGQKHYLEAIPHIGIFVQHLAHRVDQLDDQLGHEIPGSRFPSKNNRARHDLALRVSLDPVIKRDDVKYIQMLALIFMQALHLNIEYGLRVHGYTGVLFDVVGQILLVCLFDFTELPAESGVFHKCLELPEFVQMLDPAISDFAGHQGSESGIARYHKPARSHAIGNIEKFLRPVFIKIAERRLLEKLGMQLSHTVNFMAADRGKISHPNVLSSGLVDQGHARDPRNVIRVLQADPVQEAAVDFVDNFQMPGQEASKQADRPLFQGFRKQRMVSVSESLLCYLPGSVPVHPILIHEQTHELGNRNGRVGIIQLYRKCFVELA